MGRGSQPCGHRGPGATTPTSRRVKARLECGMSTPDTAKAVPPANSPLADTGNATSRPCATPPPGPFPAADPRLRAVDAGGRQVTPLVYPPLTEVDAWGMCWVSARTEEQPQRGGDARDCELEARRALGKPIHGSLSKLMAPPFCLIVTPRDSQGRPLTYNLIATENGLKLADLYRNGTLKTQEDPNEPEDVRLAGDLPRDANGAPVVPRGKDGKPAVRIPVDTDMRGGDYSDQGNARGTAADPSRAPAR